MKPRPCPPNLFLCFSFFLIISLTGCLFSGSDDGNWVEVTSPDQLVGTWSNKVGDFESIVTYGADLNYTEVSIFPDTTQQVSGVYRVEPGSIFVKFSTGGASYTSEFEYFDAKIKDGNTLSYKLIYGEDELAILRFVRVVQE